MSLNAEVDALGGLYIITKITSGSLIFTISTSHEELQYDNRVLWLTDCFKYKHTPPPVLSFLSHRTMLKPSIRISESRMLLFTKVSVSVRPTNTKIAYCYLLSHQGI